MASRSVTGHYTVVLTGDLSFGENYQAHQEALGRENILKTRGYAYSIARMSPMLLASNLVIGNLETTVTDWPASPFSGTKDYIHWSDVHETPKQLLANNLKCVSLANNHTIDYGERGLKQTLSVLEEAGIAVVGAGLDLDKAMMPSDHRIAFGLEAQSPSTSRIRIFAAFALYHKYRSRFHAYAGKSAAGTNPLRPRYLASAIADTKTSDPRCFVIVILHWRRDYKWASRKQVRVARRLLRAGADLVIGHGSHMMQEIENVEGRWVVHGLGNFVFNSPGRYEKMGAPPYSLVARLVFDSTGRRQLRLYPIMTDNRQNSYQTRFVTDAEFDTVYRLLLGRSSQAEVFEREISPGKDEFAAYLEAPI